MTDFIEKAFMQESCQKRLTFGTKIVPFFGLQVIENKGKIFGVGLSGYAAMQPIVIRNDGYFHKIDS